MTDEGDRYYERWKKGDKRATWKPATKSFAERVAKIIDSGETGGRVFKGMILVHGEEDLWRVYEEFKKGEGKQQ